MAYKSLEKQKAYQQEYYLTNLEKERARHREKYHRRGSRRIPAPSLYSFYLQKQGGVCAICKKEETKISKYGTRHKLSYDHDHITGKFRGLLCSRCNIFLGYARDDIELLQNAKEYLDEWKSRNP